MKPISISSAGRDRKLAKARHDPSPSATKKWKYICNFHFRNKLPADMFGPFEFDCRCKFSYYMESR